jgi:hypothetical protein
VCTAAVLFEFAYLVSDDGSTKDNKKCIFRRRLNMLRKVYKHTDSCFLGGTNG